MVRRTVSLPDSVDRLIAESKREDESYSAAVRRLVEASASRGAPSYVGSGRGPSDLARRAEEYLREAARSHG